MRTSSLPLLLLAACSGRAVLVEAPDSGVADPGGDSGADTGTIDTDTGSDGETGDTGADSAADTGTPADDGVLLLHDEANLHVSATLVVPATTVYASEATLFDWSRLATDLQGASILPTDVLDITLTQYPTLAVEDVADRLLEGSFLAEEVGYVYWGHVTGATTLPLVNLFPRNSAQPADKAFTDGTGVWVLSLSTGGAMPAALLTIVPSADSAVSTTAATAPQSGALSIAGSFTGAEPIVGPARPATIDWSEVTVTTQGVRFSTWAPDTLEITHFDTIWPEDVEDSLAHATAVPVGRWYAPTGGWSSLQDLSLLKGDTGDFPGFDDSGTWIVTLVCTACVLPLPLYAGLVEADPT